MPLQPKHLLSFITARRPAIRVALLAVITPLLLAPAIWQAAAGHAPGQIASGLVIVSAADFSNAVAPDSLAAAFGTGLSDRTETATPGQTLPTQLGGVSVLVEERPGTSYQARLFFVSPGQINLHVPAEISAGRKIFRVVKNTGGVATTVAQGEAVVKDIAPAIFTANRTGNGPAAALFLRVKAGAIQTYEMAYECVRETDSCTPKIIPFDDEAVYLILYATGLRRATLDVLRVMFGDEELTPDFVGPAPNLVGIEQINLLLPRRLRNRGLATTISLRTAESLPPTPPPAFAAESNNAVIANAGDPMACLTLPPDPVNAADLLIINVGKCNISLTSQQLDYRVFFQSDAGLAAMKTPESVDDTTNQIAVLVPFGAAEGNVRLETPAGEFVTSSPLKIATSISGDFFDDAGGLAHVPVTIQSQSGETSSSGGFFVSNIRVPLMAIDIDYEFGEGHPLQALPATPERHGGRIPCRTSARSGRNNQTSCNAGPANKTVANIETKTFSDAGQSAASAPEQDPTLTQQGVTLTLPKGLTATDHQGQPVKEISLGVFPDWQAPARMPAQHYSTKIASVTPFDVSFSRGTKLSFPNNDKLPPGEKAVLFFAPSPAGTLERIGTATVSPEGDRVVTAEDAVRRTGFYFVSCEGGWRTGTVFGYVTGADGRPVSRALVSTRGRAVYTNTSGAFVLSGVPVISRCTSGSPVALTTIEVSYLLPDPQPEKGAPPIIVRRARRTDVYISADAETRITPPIVLQSSADKRQPVVLAPSVVAAPQGLNNLDLEFAALDLDPRKSVRLPTATSPSISRDSIKVEQTGTSTYVLRLRELNKLPIGGFPITLTVEGEGFKVSQIVALHIMPVADQAPVLVPPLARTTDEGASVTIPLSVQGATVAAFRIVGPPAHGTAGISGASVSYKPASDFRGLDSFTYQACVGGSWANNCAGGRVSNVAIIHIAVIPADGPLRLELQGNAVPSRMPPRRDTPWRIYGSDAPWGESR